jgi:tetraacyldisaccharide 4'-kinase
VLPLGLLREGLGSLHRAHAIILSRSDQVDEATLASISTRLAAYGQPVLHARHAPAHLIPLAGGSPMAPEHFAGQSVMLASGIGNPLGFERTARSLGWNIIEHRQVPDHHHFNASDVAALTSAATRLGTNLVVTSKDAVKLRTFPEARGWVLTVELRFSDTDAATLAALVDRAHGNTR